MSVRWYGFKTTRSGGGVIGTDRQTYQLQGDKRKMGGGSNEEELGNGHTSCLALYHGVHGARTLHRAGHSISGYGALPEAQECLDQSKL